MSSAVMAEVDPLTGEVIPRLKTEEEKLLDEGFTPEGVEVHHSEEEVAERLFTVDVPTEIKSVWGWAQTSLATSSISALAEKALKSAEEVAENVKTSAEELAENVKTHAETVVQNAHQASQDAIKHEEEEEQQPQVPTSNTSSFSYPWEPKTRFSSEIRERVLRLPQENNTFLVPPPKEVNFTFDFNTNADAAMQMLQADPVLEKKRFEFVPRQLTENTFWRNYFYRVELIKRSYGADEEIAQAASLEDEGVEEEEEEEEEVVVVHEKDDDEVDAKLLDDDESMDFENDNLGAFESKKGQQESKRSHHNTETSNLSWEEELEAEVGSDNFDMLNDDEILDDGDDSDLEERIKAELNLS